MIPSNDAGSEGYLAWFVAGIPGREATTVGGRIAINGRKGNGSLTADSSDAAPVAVGRIARDSTIGNGDLPINVVEDATPTVSGGVARDGALDKCDGATFSIRDAPPIASGGVAKDRAVGEGKSASIRDTATPAAI